MLFVIYLEIDLTSVGGFLRQLGWHEKINGRRLQNLSYEYQLVGREGRGTGWNERLIMIIFKMVIP